MRPCVSTCPRLEYGGIQSEGDKARATFTIPFSSVDEYRNKVASILKAAGSKTEPTVTILNTEQVWCRVSR